MRFFFSSRQAIAMMVACQLLAACRQQAHSPVNASFPGKKIQQADTIPGPDTSRPHRIDSSKVIFLTFDDGPLWGTDNIIQTVTIEQVPVTMFMVGRQVDHKPKLEIIFHRAYVNPYMDVDNHSYSHANRLYSKYYLDPERVLKDFEKNQSMLKLRDKDARLPGRNTWRVNGRKKEAATVNGTRAANLLVENGYTIFGWDMEWEHDLTTARPKQTVEEMVRKIDAGIFNPKICFTPGYLVLLAHDEMFTETEHVLELRRLIDSLRVRHYRFASIKDYPRGEIH